MDNFGQRVNLFKKGGNTYNNTGRCETDPNGQLKDVVSRACDLYKGAKSLFEKHKSTNLISGRKSHRSLSVITVSELLLV